MWTAIATYSDPLSQTSAWNPIAKTAIRDLDFKSGERDAAIVRLLALLVRTSGVPASTRRLAEETRAQLREWR